jgi:hypothetical protein
LRGLLARDVPLAFGSLLFGFSATVHSPTCCDAQLLFIGFPDNTALWVDEMCRKTPCQNVSLLAHNVCTNHAVPPSMISITDGGME